MAVECLEAAEDVAKVDVEEAPAFGDHHVVVVAIANPHEVRRDAVPRETAHEEVRRRGVLRVARVVLAQEERYGVLGERPDEARVRAAVLGLNPRQRHGLGDDFDDAAVRPRRHGAVRRHWEVEAVLPPQPVEDAQHLQHERVLAEVVAHLEDGVDDGPAARRVVRVPVAP